VEYEGALIESTDLYRKKSGEEITKQLFCFEDKGGREVSLRPEVTPSLARMASARQRDFKKPLKWFQIGSCFRYEEPQRGRTREFAQFNADILGDASPAADAELIALAIDVMLEFGLQKDDFAIRLSDRRLWSHFLEESAVPAEHAPGFMQIIDKMERTPREATETKLAALNLSLAQIESFIASAHTHEIFAPVVDNLAARGLGSCVRIDPGIVRGLAYYTGSVFEVFDLKHDLRAVAGGGRYDNLCKLIGNADMPCTGFAMGDVVLTELLRATPGAQIAITDAVLKAFSLDVYGVIADEAARPQALAAVQNLRASGMRADFALSPAKVGKQFQAAEERRARFAVVFGSEHPVVKIKNLISRHEISVEAGELASKLAVMLREPEHGVLLAGS
jgi:histidyl-tRNA synthetase